MAMLEWLRRRILLVLATSYLSSKAEQKVTFPMRFMLENCCCQDHGLYWDIFQASSDILNKTSFVKSESHRITVLFSWLGAINHGCMPPTNKNVSLLDRQESWKGSQEECSILKMSLFILDSVQDVFISLAHFQKTPQGKAGPLH